MLSSDQKIYHKYETTPAFSFDFTSCSCSSPLPKQFSISSFMNAMNESDEIIFISVFFLDGNPFPVYLYMLNSSQRR